MHYGCGLGWQILVTAIVTRTGDTIKAFEIADREFAAVSQPIEFAGKIIALWTARMEAARLQFRKSRKRGNMRRINFPLLVASSLFLAVLAGAETRPHYGGTLHVAIRAAPVSLDPSEIARAHGQTSANLVSLLFDTLITSGRAGTIAARAGKVLAG